MVFTRVYKVNNFYRRFCSLFDFAKLFTIFVWNYHFCFEFRIIQTALKVNEFIIENHSVPSFDKDELNISNNG